MHGLLIEHTTIAGKRDTVREIWERLMRPAIAGNPGHLAYAYSYGPKDDGITAFQVYSSKAEAEAFLVHQPYIEYLEASLPFLAGSPKVTILDILWLK